MKNLRVFLFACPLALMLSGCPIYVGDDDGTGPSPTCERDSDCGSSEVCDDGMCVPVEPECETASDCSGSDVCTDGRCVPAPCSEDSDCGSGEVCDAGTCRDNTCRTHGDCPSGQYCDDASGECTPSSTCTGDADCADEPGRWCDFRDTCVPTDPGACRTTADCAGAQECVEGQCRDVDDTCHFDRDCPPGTVCLNNTCARVCTGDGDCLSGSSCDGGFCRPNPSECSSSSACGAGEHCVDGRCLPDCEGGGSCDTDEYCAEDLFCRPDWRPEPFCTQDMDCRTGRVCREGVCRTPCPDMLDETCMRFDSQVPECRMVTGGEYLCHATNELTPECRVQVDCGADDCIDGSCRNRS